MLQVVLAGFLLGFSLILAIGAQNAFVLRQGLKQSHVAVVVAICAGSDAILILAGVGGMMWAQYQAVVNSQIGDSMTILVFIILIIGGLGSVGGCFIGAILVGLTANYVGFLAPKLALGSNILLMALILLWRPRGLFPLAEHH